MTDENVTTVVLASASASRRRMLSAAGVNILAQAARVDEEEVKNSMQAAGMEAGEVAEALAELKAQRISPQFHDAIVLGADQMLAVDGEWLDKPADADALRDHLKKLRGRSHRLISCVVAVKNGARIWHQTDTATITMRPCSDAFIDWYVDRAGDSVLDSVGGYQLEGLGAQLFSHVQGDFFTVLGMPLLPLLDFLRLQGVLRT